MRWQIHVVAVLASLFIGVECSAKSFVNLAASKPLGNNCCTISTRPSHLRRWSASGGKRACESVCRNEATCVGFDVDSKGACNMYSVGNPASKPTMYDGERVVKPEDLIIGSASGKNTTASFVLCKNKGVRCFVVKKTAPGGDRGGSASPAPRKVPLKEGKCPVFTVRKQICDGATKDLAAPAENLNSLLGTSVSQSERDLENTGRRGHAKQGVTAGASVPFGTALKKPGGGRITSRVPAAYSIASALAIRSPQGRSRIHMNRRVRRCNCANGTPAKGIKCPANGKKKCISCNPGYHATATLCTENMCSCANGTPAKGIKCPHHDKKQCISCHPGFHSEGTLCTENKCSCANGIPAKATECPIDGARKCMKCKPGFYDTGLSCLENVCKCPQGTPARGIKCPIHRGPRCSSCNPGYHNTKNWCQENRCICKNGIGARGVECLRHGGPKCIACKPGFWETGNSCKEKQCRCENGTPATGIECSSADAPKCISCKSGFKNLGTQCVGCRYICERMPMASLEKIEAPKGMQWDKKPKQNEGISKTGDCKVSTAAAFAKCANGPPKKYKNYVLHCDCERAYTSIDQKTAVVAATSPACSSFNRKALSKKAAKDAQKTLDDYAVAWFNACGKWLKGAKDEPYRHALPRELGEAAPSQNGRLVTFPPKVLKETVGPCRFEVQLKPLACNTGHKINVRIGKSTLQPVACGCDGTLIEVKVLASINFMKNKAIKTQKSCVAEYQKWWARIRTTAFGSKQVFETGGLTPQTVSKYSKHKSGNSVRSSVISQLVHYSRSTIFNPALEMLSLCTIARRSSLEQLEKLNKKSEHKRNATQERSTKETLRLHRIAQETKTKEKSEKYAQTQELAGKEMSSKNKQTEERTAKEKLQKAAEKSDKELIQRPKELSAKASADMLAAQKSAHQIRKRIARMELRMEQEEKAEINAEKKHKSAVEGTKKVKMKEAEAAKKKLAAQVIAKAATKEGTTPINAEQKRIKTDAAERNAKTKMQKMVDQEDSAHLAKKNAKQKNGELEKDINRLRIKQAANTHTMRRDRVLSQAALRLRKKATAAMSKAQKNLLSADAGVIALQIQIARAQQPAEKAGLQAQLKKAMRQRTDVEAGKSTEKKQKADPTSSITNKTTPAKTDVLQKTTKTTKLKSKEEDNVNAKEKAKSKAKTKPNVYRQLEDHVKAEVDIIQKYDLDPDPSLY